MFYPKTPFLTNPIIEAHLIKSNPTVVEELLPWLCHAPKITTYRVNLLKSTLSAFKERVQKLLSEKYPNNTPLVFTIAQIPEILCIGTVDGNTMQQTNVTAIDLKQVVVDSCCGAALLRGAHIYAPGVLAMEAGTRLHEKVAIYADLDGKCKRGTNSRYESPHKLFIGRGVVHMQRYQIYGENPLRGVAVELQTNVSGVPSIGDLSSAEALLQNLPSIVCVRVLDPKPGEIILDMCAAPGNKTTHIAELIQDNGVLVALDKTESKIRQVRDKVQLYGFHSIRPFAHDATKALKEEDDDATLTNCDIEPPFPGATFDRILLDAPCSALGNRPLLSTRGLTAKMLQSYPNVQRKLLSTAVQLLKPGGVLVYSTCTITDAENEAMVKWALDKYPQLQLVPATPRFGSNGLPGLGLSEQECGLVQRFGHSNENVHSQFELNTVGFFIAKFKKLT